MTEFPPLNILFICTGNICRSPMAVQLVLHELAAVSGEAAAGRSVRVQSRGTHARVGSPMDPPAARQSVAMGGDPSGHEAAQLVQDDLRDADLVVAMTLDHRAAAARMFPAASKKSVTLLELKRLIDYLEPGSGGGAAGRRASPRDSLATLLATRSSVPSVRHDDDLSIPDPFRRSSGAHAKVAREIQSAVSTLAGWLGSVLPAVEPAPPTVGSRPGGAAPQRVVVETPEPAWAAEPVPVPVTEPVRLHEHEPEPVTDPISVVTPERMPDPVPARSSVAVALPTPVPAPVPAPVLAVGLAPDAPLTRRQLRAQAPGAEPTVAAPLTRRQLRAQVPGAEPTVAVPLTRRAARALQERELAERASVQEEYRSQADQKAERISGQHVGREVHPEQHTTRTHAQHGEHSHQPEPR
ncbi:hypothetical protein B7R21_03620 [Subtercola boreus]|uniref:protein-tyrosine-phosphatase n=1 Tax=Subtercola boreus TaxID=120213 RepID=A0A3E0W2S2_9MICO|nr:hypothetical protein B7R21_03620 [Subtercola boreus]